MPNDGGYFLLDDEEKQTLINEEPQSIKFIRPLLSAHEFLNGHKRWCIWLKGIPPNEIRNYKTISERVNSVKTLRENSNREATKRLSKFPTLFGEIRQPNTEYILVPRHSSENRAYIPMGFFSPDFIASDSCLFIANAKMYHFGIMTSLMHMAWVKTTCGRIKSDFRYSNEMVYNNFPWPENPNEKQVQTVETAAQNVLDARAQFPDASLADLYDPNTMPPVLVKAHQALDKAVDLAYRPQPFTSEANRMVFLFELYEKYTADLFTKEKVKKK
ncbi:MAG TPA: DNA methyltransferase, partial [Sphingobacteriaceae bacterium]|nr:DNA methyltransferase [Sphingobacteriaceae bacterium]